jgi:hypothetical protein
MTTMLRVHRRTFNTLAEATAFSVATLDNLAPDARRSEAAFQQRSATRPQPERHTDGLAEVVPWEKNV